MEKFEINIDTVRYYNKDKVAMGSVNENLEQNVEILSLEEMADEVGNKGRAFTRALLKGGRTSEDFVRQHFLVLDFDGTCTYKVFKKRCEEYNLPFAFTYKTLSCKRGDYRFRAVFVMNITITDAFFAKTMNRLLCKVFPESDVKCVDIPRIMLGGKGLIDKNYDARVDIMDVVCAVQDHMKKTQPSNFSRDIQAFAKDIGVKIYNGCLGILRKEEVPEGIEAELIVQEDIVMICHDGKNDIRMEGCKKGENTRGEFLKELRGYDEDTLRSYCPLLDDYARSETDMDHGLKYILAGSLSHISGGKTIFFKYLKNHVEKWKRDWENYIKPQYPKRCRGNCPYSDRCNCDSLYQKLSRKIIKTSDIEDYFPLETCVNSLEQSLHYSVENNEKGIYLIKGQTALGKTEVYCKMVQEMPDKKFLIAVPTCKLQDEVAARLEQKGVRCYRTVSLYNAIMRLGIDELSGIVQQDYESGFGRQVKKRIRVYYEQHKDELGIWQKKELKKLLGRKEKPKDVACIVTTHAYFLMMDYREIGDYEVIIDEDLLMTLFKKNGSVPVEDIQYAVKNNTFGKENTDILKGILKMRHEEARQVNFRKLTDGQLERLYSKASAFKGAMPLLLESTCVAMDKNSGTVLFFQKTEIPCRKLIVLSASADPKLYEDYFHGWKIHFMEIYKARYKGKVIQYTAHSMSRDCVKRYGQETVNKYIEKITGPITKITFKMFDLADSIHFGKTEGFDEFKGKNLAVIGTPHNLPALYKMLGEALGYNSSDVLCKRRIERNGYSFTFMTFSDMNMQNLQLFFIETELEQAIGRARVLRYDSTVYVFSNYPCAQAEIVQESYLPEIKEEEKEQEMDNAEK